MRALAGGAEQDDQDEPFDPDPLEDLDWADNDQGLDPFCGWCGEQGFRWIMRDGVAVIAPCEKCSGLDD